MHYWRQFRIDYHTNGHFYPIYAGALRYNIMAPRDMFDVNPVLGAEFWFDYIDFLRRSFNWTFPELDDESEIDTFELVENPIPVLTVDMVYEDDDDMTVVTEEDIVYYDDADDVDSITYGSSILLGLSQGNEENIPPPYGSRFNPIIVYDDDDDFSTTDEEDASDIDDLWLD